MLRRKMQSGLSRLALTINIAARSDLLSKLVNAPNRCGIMKIVVSRAEIGAEDKNSNKIQGKANEDGDYPISRLFRPGRWKALNRARYLHPD